MYPQIASLSRLLALLGPLPYTIPVLWFKSDRQPNSLVIVAVTLPDPFLLFVFINQIH